jgi:ComF family protein
MPVWSDIVDGMLTLLFPPRCAVCNTLQEPVVCDACRSTFTPITEPYCQQCGLPFDPKAKSNAHCADCRTTPPDFDAARAAGVYQGTLRTAIHHFKYGGVQALAAPLAAWMHDHVTLPFAPDLLCPVPLHPQRQALRGYNQSGLLAEGLGATWQIPVETALLTRTANTPPQMQLPAAERRRNVRGVFVATRDVTGRVVGVVDDVYTTGATLNECARALKRAGATRVLALTIARVTLDAAS